MEARRQKTLGQHSILSKWLTRRVMMNYWRGRDREACHTILPLIVEAMKDGHRSTIALYEASIHGWSKRAQRDRTNGKCLAKAHTSALSPYTWRHYVLVLLSTFTVITSILRPSTQQTTPIKVAKSGHRKFLAHLQGAGQSKRRISTPKVSGHGGLSFALGKIAELSASMQDQYLSAALHDMSLQTLQRLIETADGGNAWAGTSQSAQ